MSQIHFSIPASEQERKTAIHRLIPEDEMVDFIKADMVLGLACQDHCHTREALSDYALREQLVPYLKPFLERRGWIDDDWDERLQVLSERFLHQVS